MKKFIKQCPCCKTFVRAKMNIKRYFYREVFIEGMNLNPGAINIYHKGKGCHVKWTPVKRLKQVKE